MGFQTPCFYWSKLFFGLKNEKTPMNCGVCTKGGLIQVIFHGFPARFYFGKTWLNVVSTENV